MVCIDSVSRFMLSVLLMACHKDSVKNSPGQRPNGVLDLPETSSCVCVIVSRPRKVGRPRASSVQSPSDATEAVLCQSLSRSWRPVICDGFCRRIQKTPLKCSDWSSLSTSILESAIFEKVSNLQTFFLECFGLYRWGHGTL